MGWEPLGGPPPSEPFGWVPPLAAPPPSSASSRRMIVSLGVVIAVLVIVVLVAIKQSSVKGISASPAPLPGASGVGVGRVIYTDDFSDSGSGWTTQTLASGTTFGYTPQGYVISGRGTLHHFAGAPFSLPLRQAQVSMTATQSGGAPTGSGFGVACRRPTSEVRPSTLNRYEFLVDSGNRFYVERLDGLLSIRTGPSVLREGTAPAGPGAVALTIDALCSTMADGRSTRLAFFIDGHKVVDFVDVAPRAVSAGWLASIDVNTQASAPSTVTVTHFAERDPTVPSS